MSKVQFSETRSEEMKKPLKPKLNESNSFEAGEGIRIGNAPIDGLVYVNFSKEALIVEKFNDPAKAKEAELAGQERINALVERMKTRPSAKEIEKLLKKNNL